MYVLLLVMLVGAAAAETKVSAVKMDQSGRILTSLGNVSMVAERTGEGTYRIKFNKVETEPLAVATPWAGREGSEVGDWPISILIYGITRTEVQFMAVNKRNRLVDGSAIVQILWQ